MIEISIIKHPFSPFTEGINTKRGAFKMKNILKAPLLMKFGLSLRLFGAQFCSRFESDNLLRSDFDRLFGNRVDTCTRASFHHVESSETYQ